MMFQYLTQTVVISRIQRLRVQQIFYSERITKKGRIFELRYGEGEGLNPEEQTSCKQNSSRSKYIIHNPFLEPFKKLVITTIEIREANAVFQETRLFSPLSITGKVEVGIFNTNIFTYFEKYKSYLTLIDFQNRFFCNA